MTKLNKLGICQDGVANEQEVSAAVLVIVFLLRTKFFIKQVIILPETYKCFPNKRFAQRGSLVRDADTGTVTACAVTPEGLHHSNSDGQAREDGPGVQLPAVWMQVTRWGETLGLESVLVLFRLTPPTFPVGSVSAPVFWDVVNLPFPSCEVLSGVIFILCSSS